MKRTWNLAPVSRIVQKITENYCNCLYLSTSQVWWLPDLRFKNIYSKMHLISCTNTHHDVCDLVNHGIVKNTKTWISCERNLIFLRNKKTLNLCFRWNILRSYRFVAEVTFKWCILAFRSFVLFALTFYILCTSVLLLLLF